MPKITLKTRNKLERTANTVRQDIIRMLSEAGSGHAAGPLGLADILTALYFHILNHRPRKPLWTDRDRLTISCGHVAPVVYATLARARYFSISELKTFRTLGTRLQGHIDSKYLPGIESTAASLGQGCGIAVGRAYAARMNNETWHSFAILSDGELNEGSTWESLMFAAKERLSNLTFIVDRNNIQISGTTKDVMPLEPLRNKFEAFNWHVIEIDGHDFSQIIDACNAARTAKEKPSVIIAHTVPGKGVSFMEGAYHWHGNTPTPEQAKQALKELRAIQNNKHKTS